MEFISGLNTQQQQAVTSGTGPVLVLAGPGSGKTRVLTYRIAYLIGALGVRPYHIMAVTFTNKAAKEMETRVTDLLGPHTQGLMLGTFHSICARVLRREAEHLPFSQNFVIYDADDQVKLTKQVIRNLDIDEKRHRPVVVHAAISNAKNELISPDDLPISSYKDEVVKRVYEQYQQLLLTSNALDFDDLLLWTANLMEDNPDVRQRYSRRFEHILVDEFQDTNMAQYTLLSHLASFHRNIFVVGDTDQSIYRWRGADYRNVLKFEKNYPDTQVILLEQNYRSTQNILDTAMAVIKQNPIRTHKALFTDRGSGQKIIVRELYDDREEAQFVINTIATLTAKKTSQPGDFAIMYRVNAQSRVLEEAFLSASLPYKLVGAQRFYGRREIKDIISYIRLIHNPKDEVSLIRVINMPTRGIGNKTLTNLRIQAKKAKISMVEMLLDLALDEDSKYKSVYTSRAALMLSRFGKMLSRWMDVKSSKTPLELMDQVVDDIDYQGYLDIGTDEGRDRWENITELRRLAREYNEKGLERFLEDIALVSDQDTLDDGANVPTLLTLHAAKGLEFPNVFIVGLNEGNLPHIRSFDDVEEMAEERRLFYVGITRAKNQLHLLHTLNRSIFGYSEPSEPSRFMGDIPPELMDSGSPRQMLARRDRASHLYQWDKSEVAQVQKPEKEYAAGTRVEHSRWGEGLILNSKLLDGDEILDIFFDTVGLKRVVASLAKLEIKN